MNILEKISCCPAPAGSEQKIIQFLSDTLPKFGCKVMADSHKNLIVHKDGEGKPLIVMAPLDTPCLYITHIDEKGFLRFQTAGNIKVLPGTSVVLKSGAVGVVATEKGKEESRDMFIDIGATNAAQAEKLASISDYAIIKPAYDLMGDFAGGPFMGNRGALCAAVQAALSNTRRNVYFVFTAKTSISQHSPSFLKKIGEECEMLISVEKSLANDFLGEEYTSVRAGGGPCIRMRDGGMVSSAAVISLFERSAGDIKTQREVAQNIGNAAAIQKAYGGIWAGSLGIATRYTDNIYEVVSLFDIENTANLIKNCLN